MLKPRVKSILLTVCLTDLFRVTAKILGAVALFEEPIEGEAWYPLNLIV